MSLEMCTIIVDHRAELNPSCFGLSPIMMSRVMNDIQSRTCYKAEAEVRVMNISIVCLLCIVTTLAEVVSRGQTVTHLQVTVRGGKSEEATSQCGSGPTLLPARLAWNSILNLIYLKASLQPFTVDSMENENESQ